MPARVVFAANAFESGLAELRGEFGELLSFAWRLKAGQDAFDHPGAAQIQSGEVVKFAVGKVSDVGRFEVERGDEGGIPGAD